MSKKRKVIVLSCMIALLAITAVFNFIMTTTIPGEEDLPVISSANYFSQYRTERLTTRNEELLQLDAVISASEKGSVEYNEALSMKTDITAITEKEMLLENLIKAYGFEDAVVVIGLDSDNINVITKTAELSSDDATKIYTIIAEEMSTSIDNVKIIPIS